MGAAGLAAATIVSGLSFGAPAASASAEDTPRASRAIQPPANGTEIRLAGLRNDGTAFYSTYIQYSTTPKLADAIRQSTKLRVTHSGDGTFRLVYVTGNAAGTCAAYNTSANDNTMGNLRCSDGETRYRLDDSGRIVPLARPSLYMLNTGVSALTGTYIGFGSSGGAAKLPGLNDSKSLTATVGEVNNIAKTAVVSGTATPGAKVSIGSQEVQANPSGVWSMTVNGLAVGKNDLIVIQKIDGTEFDRKTVSATIVDGGGLFAVDQGPVELERGETTQVPFVVENRVSRTDTKGTVVLTAPDGATFSEQDTVQGSWRRVGNTAWNASTSIPLTNGRLSNDNTTLTFDVDWASERPADQQYRFMVDVAANEDAPEVSSSMDFDFTGTSSTNDFRAQGKTTTTVTDAEIPAPDALVVTTPADDSTVDTKRPVFSGTGDEGATIEIRDADDNLIATTVVEDGAWSVPATADLADGSYEFDVIQTPLTGAPSTEHREGLLHSRDEPAHDRAHRGRRVR